MSSMKKLIESIDSISETPADDVTIRFTREEAERLGLLTCKCGHPLNNHFQHKGSCAHCTCARYREVPRAGQIVTDELAPGKSETLAKVQNNPEFNDNDSAEVRNLISTGR